MVEHEQLLHAHPGLEEDPSRRAASLGYGLEEHDYDYDHGDGGIGFSRGGVYGDDMQLDAPTTRLGLDASQAADTGLLLKAVRQRRLDRYWTTSSSESHKGAIVGARRVRHTDGVGDSMILGSFYR